MTSELKTPEEKEIARLRAEVDELTKLRDAMLELKGWQAGHDYDEMLNVELERVCNLAAKIDRSKKNKLQNFVNEIVSQYIIDNDIDVDMHGERQAISLSYSTTYNVTDYGESEFSLPKSLIDNHYDSILEFIEYELGQNIDDFVDMKNESSYLENEEIKLI